jgi:hypothetical protein
MKRASVFVLAILIVILISTIAWAVLKNNGSSTSNAASPTPGAGSQLPVSRDSGAYLQAEVPGGLHEV